MALGFANTLYMGNINADSMEAIMSSKPVLLFQQRHTQGVQSCAPCEYKPICNSGCADQAYLMRGSVLEKDGFCPGYKALFTHIEMAVRKELGGETHARQSAK